MSHLVVQPCGLNWRKAAGRQRQDEEPDVNVYQFAAKSWAGEVSPAELFSTVVDGLRRPQLGDTA
jgi:hypothetical protein